MVIDFAENPCPLLKCLAPSGTAPQARVAAMSIVRQLKENKTAKNPDDLARTLEKWRHNGGIVIKTDGKKDGQALFSSGKPWARWGQVFGCLDAIGFVHCVP
ncbi:unnamed protein product, partial [Amoebophrya sp. A25]|eukprot:GSA25T00017194001.1